jgi:hypothetical protein
VNYFTLKCDLDVLLVNDSERDPEDELKFKAVSQMDPLERQAKEFLTFAKLASTAAAT